MDEDRRSAAKAQDSALTGLRCVAAEDKTYRQNNATVSMKNNVAGMVGGVGHNVKHVRDDGVSSHDFPPQRDSSGGG